MDAPTRTREDFHKAAAIPASSASSSRLPMSRDHTASMPLFAKRTRAMPPASPSAAGALWWITGLSTDPGPNDS